MLKTLLVFAASAALIVAHPSPSPFAKDKDTNVGDLDLSGIDLSDISVEDISNVLDNLGYPTPPFKDLPKEAQNKLKKEYTKEQLEGDAGHALRFLVNRCYTGDCGDDQKGQCLDKIVDLAKELEDEAKDIKDHGAKTTEALDRVEKKMEDDACFDWDTIEAGIELLVDHVTDESGKTDSKAVKELFSAVDSEGDK